MNEITDAQRNSLDSQIRIYYAAGLIRNQKPALNVAHTQSRASQGQESKIACPYNGNCFSQDTSLCIPGQYRECVFYKMNLALDLVGGRVHLPEPQVS